LNGNAEIIAYIRQMLGLCLTGYVGEKSFWFWQGDTDAGKTTLLTILVRLLGPFVYSIPLRAILKHRQDTGILHDIAGVRGMRLVYAEEFKPGDVLDSSWVKKVSGGGDITADRKGEPNVTFRSTAKLIIGTNDMPALTDIDDAIRGRVRVIPFPANVPAAMKAAGKSLSSIDEVVEDLLTEAPAILYDLVLAVGEWRAAGARLTMPEAVAGASKTYMDAQDPLVEWLDACFMKKPDGSLTDEREELTLKKWYFSFIAQSGKADTNSLYQRFGDMLISKGFTKRVTYVGKQFTGPMLTVPARNFASYAQEEAEGRKGRYGRY
jgi:putative DNA primase/helicase